MGIVPITVYCDSASDAQEVKERLDSERNHLCDCLRRSGWNPTDAPMGEVMRDGLEHFDYIYLETEDGDEDRTAMSLNDSGVVHHLSVQPGVAFTATSYQP